MFHSKVAFDDAANQGDADELLALQHSFDLAMDGLVWVLDPLRATSPVCKEKIRALEVGRLLKNRSEY